MDFDVVQDLETTSLLFKVLVLLAVAAAYVIFEAVLTRLNGGSQASGSQASGLQASGSPAFGRLSHLEPFAARAELAKLAVEAYRPISSWSSPKSTD